MTANVFGERFIGRDTPAWHQLGTVFTTPISAKQAVVAAKLGYKVQIAPLSAGVDDVSNPISGVLTGIHIPNRFGLMREPTPDDPEWRCFGLVSDMYHQVDNYQIAEYLESLVGEWPVETAGALGYGETIFFSLDAGMTDVAGEDVHQYFLMTDTKDGKTSMRMAFTPVRVVCQNTLSIGTAAATVLQWLPHTSETDAKLAYRMKLLTKLQSIKGTTMINFQRMAKSILSDEAIGKVIGAAYPLPNRPGKAALLDEITEKDAADYGTLYEEMTSAQDQWAYYCERALSYRVRAMDILTKMNEENGKLANTPWYVYNAVTDNEDHRDGPASLFSSALWGDRARTKVRAYQMALAMTPIAAPIQPARRGRPRKNG
jgi:phage/plasmid-like protein (TIGR03299 family)